MTDIEIAHAQPVGRVGVEKCLPLPGLLTVGLVRGLVDDRLPACLVAALLLIGGSLGDPRTGEIIKGMARMDSHRARTSYNLYAGLMGAAPSAADTAFDGAPSRCVKSSRSAASPVSAEPTSCPSGPRAALRKISSA